jgi:hypothetical protein
MAIDRRIPRPEICLLLFALSVFVFHQLPALAGERAGDVIDLLTPFAVIGSAAAALIALGARGPVLVAAGIAAILYVDGHGIHLSANSIANEGPGPEVEDLVHFWDEIFSHIEAVLGWFGLVACICWAEERRGGSGASQVSGRVRVATVLLLGWTFFTSTVEGGTWPIELAATACFLYWLAGEGRRPLLVTSTAAYALAAAGIGAYAIWQGGVSQFTDAGLL